MTCFVTPVHACEILNRKIASAITVIILFAAIPACCLLVAMFARVDERFEILREMCGLGINSFVRGLAREEAVASDCLFVAGEEAVPFEVSQAFC